MTNDGTHSYSYDAEGNILSVDGGGTAAYVNDALKSKDALNRRVSVKTASSAHEYRFDYAGRRVSSWLLNQAGYPQGFGDEARIYWDGRQIAYRAYDGNTYFDHQDYLGTERLRTNYAETPEVSMTSLPFGDRSSQAVGGYGPQLDPAGFAGLDFDQESGTDHAQFRNDSVAQGRWLSPDPYHGSYDITNPQSLNRYAYVLNNPLTFTDPTGLQYSTCANGPNCNLPGGPNWGGGGGCGPTDASCGSSGDPYGPCCGFLGGIAAGEELLAMANFTYALGDGVVTEYRACL